MPESVAAEWVKTSALKLASWNPRKNEQAVEPVMHSIKQFGFASPIVALRDGTVIAGNTRLKAANRLGLKEVPVRYVDLSLEQAKRYAQADNRLGEIADWDNAALLDIWADEPMDSLLDLGWSEKDVLSIRPESETEEGELQVDEDDFDSVVGQTYQLGPHTLYCGSALDCEWEVVDCVWTDPPYGVDLGDANRNRQEHSYKDIEGDESLSVAAELATAVFGKLALRDGGCAYMSCGYGVEALTEFFEVFKALANPKWVLVWLKQSVFTRADYNSEYEPVVYGWKGGAPHEWNGVHSSNVFRFDRPKDVKGHPTPKPIGLIKACLQNSTSPGDLVADPFGGSGSTLIACAESGRICRTSELEPMYCDLIRRRWTSWCRANGADPGPGALA